MIAAGIGYLVLFILFVVTKSFLPDAGGGWSDPPIFDYLYILGFGICLSIIAIGYTYYSWTLSEEEYLEWYKDQQLFGRNLIEKWRRLYPKGMVIWTNRIFAPVGGLLGIALSGFMLFAIFKYILS
ncbi:MAG TPA: hypothetical protein VLE49_05315 [Anaerolineales bacterium]|nr:hypothetical protein [Anaerolineales bacterium]